MRFKKWKRNATRFSAIRWPVKYCATQRMFYSIFSSFFRGRPNTNRLVNKMKIFIFPHESQIGLFVISVNVTIIIGINFTRHFSCKQFKFGMWGPCYQQCCIRSDATFLNLINDSMYFSPEQRHWHVSRGFNEFSWRVLWARPVTPHPQTITRNWVTSL